MLRCGQGMLRMEVVMTVRRTVGFVLLAALVLLSCVAIPYAAWLCYDGSVNKDDAWNFDSLTAGWTALFLWGAIAALALAVYACLPSRRSAVLLTGLCLAALLPPLLGQALGEYGWRREFQRNRRHAEEAIEAVEEYRKEHGTYPDRLEDVRRPITITLYRGRHTHPLEYGPGGPGGFVLQYRYGWYIYTYDPGKAEWSRTD